MQVYDFKCSVCGEQLNFRETRDKDGDLVIEVLPCSACCLESVVDGLKILKWGQRGDKIRGDKNKGAKLYA